MLKAAFSHGVIETHGQGHVPIFGFRIFFSDEFWVVGFFQVEFSEFSGFWIFFCFVLDEFWILDFLGGILPVFFGIFGLKDIFSVEFWVPRSNFHVKVSWDFKYFRALGFFFGSNFRF